MASSMTSKIDAARKLVRDAELPPELLDYGAEDAGSYALPEARFPYYDGSGTRFAARMTPTVLAGGGRGLG